MIFQNHPPCYVSSDSSLPRCQPCTHLIASTSALRICMHVSLISPLHRLLCMLFHAAPPDFTLPGIVTTAGRYPFIVVLSSLPDLAFIGIVILWLSSVLPRYDFHPSTSSHLCCRPAVCTAYCSSCYCLLCTIQPLPSRIGSAFAVRIVPPLFRAIRTAPLPSMLSSSYFSHRSSSALV